MRLYTFVSDKVFLATLLVSAATLAASFYYFADSFAETMLMEKNNGAIVSLKIESERSEFALMGTSHATGHIMPAGLHYINMTGGHNLPPAMYYEAKALLKYATTIKTVYLEADDHLFTNGPAYNIKTNSEDGAVRNSMYEVWQAYFDEEGKSIFGSNTEKTAFNELLLLQPDIKPILLKRMAGKVFQQSAQKSAGNDPKNNTSACATTSALQQPETSKETYWSRLRREERALALIRRISDFALDKPTPLSPLMTEYYEKTIQLFLDHGIAVVLVRFPMAPDFQKGVHPENTKNINAYLDNLRKKNKLPMLDITYLSGNGDRFFENEDHVHPDFFPLIGKIIVKDFCENRQ